MSDWQPVRTFPAHGGDLDLEKEQSDLARRIVMRVREKDISEVSPHVFENRVNRGCDFIRKMCGSWGLMEIPIFTFASTKF
jgi:hypothetical protein